MGGMLELWLNIAIAILLAATIFYCWLLNRRIQVLQNSKSELAMLLKHFDLSTQRASKTMNILQEASKEAGKSVQQRIEKAQYILDDLNYMMEKADKVAEQMEAGIAIARQRHKIEEDTVSQVVISAKQATAPKITVNKKTTEPRVLESLSLKPFDEDEVEVISDITKDSIIKSLREAKAAGKEDDGAVSSLRQLIDQVVLKNQQKNLVAKAEDMPNGVGRKTSRGEQALLKALQTQGAS